VSDTSPTPPTSPEAPSASGLDHARLRNLRDAAAALLETDPREALRLARACESLEGAADDGVVTGPTLLLTGKALMAASDFHSARTSMEQALALFGAAGDLAGLAESHSALGKIFLNIGLLELSVEHLEHSLDLTGRHTFLGSRAIMAGTFNQLAGVRYIQGEVGDAVALLHRSLQIWQEDGNFLGQVQCLINIGNTQSALAQYSEAIKTFSRAYKLQHQNSQNFKLEATLLHNLARTHHLDGDNPRAIKMLGSAYTAAQASQDKQVEASVALSLGTFHLQAANIGEAQLYLETALDLCRGMSYPFGELSALNSLGNLYEKTGQSLLAYVTYHDALAIALSIGSTQGELEARLNLGRFYLHSHSWEDALTQLQLALELAERTQSAKEAATAHETLCDLHKAQGDAAQALHHSEELRRLERELFNAERDRQTRNLSIQFEVERAQREADSYRLRTELEQEARQMAERQVEERTAELAQAQYEVVTRLAMAAEYRDGTTGDHTRRVGVMSARLARALGWTEARAELLGIAARLHDVGKMGIPDSILLKSGRLEAGEFTQMQTHTLIGATILSGGHSELLQLAEEIALTHHERWDGCGYPRRLAGTQIPLSGRIVAVADVYDALTQVRPYKKAWGHDDAVQELRAQAGRHFDPEVVEAALSVLCSPEDLHA
jgi:HD-GYP domain-containing protein (c-di-GMP phosphodiesterase class II)